MAFYGVQGPDTKQTGNRDREFHELVTYCGVERLRDAIFIHLLDAMPHQIVQPDFGTTFLWASTQTDIVSYPAVRLKFTSYQRGDWGETIHWRLIIFDDATGPDGREASRGTIDGQCQIHTNSVQGALGDRFWGSG